MTLATEQPTLLFTTPHHALGYWGPVLVCIWRKETTPLGVTHLLQAHKEVAWMNLGGMGLFTIIEARAPAPPADVRGALARYMANSGDVIKMSSVAFEGSGFHAAMIRSVVTGLTMLARQPFPHKVFANVEDAARWMAVGLRDTAGVPMEADMLLSRIFALRSLVSAAEVSSSSPAA